MPASNLPLELLWTILRNLTAATPFGTEYIDAESLLAFSLVCRWWRRVALTQKMLWKFLDLAWDQERFTTWAERAGEGVPLHFHYDDTFHIERTKVRWEAEQLKRAQPSSNHVPSDSTLPGSIVEFKKRPPWVRRTEQPSRWHHELVRRIALHKAFNPQCASLSVTCANVQSYQSIWGLLATTLPTLKSLEIGPILKAPPDNLTFIGNNVHHPGWHWQWTHNSVHETTGRRAGGLGAHLNGQHLPALESLRMISTVTMDYRSTQATLTSLHLVDAPARTRDTLLVEFTALRELSIVGGVETSLDPPPPPPHMHMNPQDAHLLTNPLTRFSVPKLEVLYLYDPAPQLLSLLATREELPKLTTLVVGRLGTTLGLFKTFLRHCDSVTSLRIKDDADAQITLLELGQLRRVPGGGPNAPIENTAFFSDLVELEVYDLPWPYSHLAPAEQKRALRPLTSSKESKNFKGLKEFLKVWTAHRSSILERIHLRSTIGDPMRNPEDIPAWVWDSADVLTVDGQPWDILEKRQALNLNEGE
ncbi:hypothetical protein DL93DRAFT_2073980 [Clavulina sp. PMI_390]|nr:hypothetical protein DL93DRAFT_2073980 [Clavulina sp. PMI_390]